MEKTLTPLEAFDDFLIWVRQSERWDALDDYDKNRISQAKSDRSGRRGVGLGVRRIESILKKYAGSRYKFLEPAVVVVE